MQNFGKLLSLFKPKNHLKLVQEIIDKVIDNTNLSLNENTLSLLKKREQKLLTKIKEINSLDIKNEKQMTDFIRSKQMLAIVQQSIVDHIGAIPVEHLLKHESNDIVFEIDATDLAKQNEDLNKLEDDL